MLLLLLLLLLLLVARASAATRGGAISGLACAETRVLSRSSPGVEFVFFSHRFVCGVFSKRLRHLVGYTVQEQLSCPFRIVIFWCFLMCVEFRIGFCCDFADSRLFAHASLDFHWYVSSVQGWVGVMTSMRMRILCCVSLVDLVLVRSIGGDGGLMTSMRMQLLCCVSLLALCFAHWLGGRGWGAFRIGLWCFPKKSGQHCADPRLFAHASLDFHVYLTSVQGWGGAWGGG